MGLLSTLLGAVMSGAPMPLGSADPYPVSANGHDPLAALPPDVQQAPVRPPDPSSFTPQLNTPRMSVNTPMQPPPVNNPQDVQVMGDSWTPKKETTLGHIYDFLSGDHTYEKKTDEENLKSAMQGFDENPIRTIRRVAKVDPKAAWAMYNQYHDNKIQDDIAKNREDDETLGRGSGLLATATPQSYPIIKQRLEQYFQSKGFDPGIPLPDSYDAEAIQGWREGTLKGKEQMDYESQNNYRQERLKQFNQQIMSNNAYRGARLNQFDRSISNTEAYRQQRLGQIGQGLGEHQRHDLAIEGHSVPTPGTRELSPDRTVMREFRSDGQWHIFKKVNGKIHEVGILAPKSQGGTKYNPEDYADTPDDEDQ